MLDKGKIKALLVVAATCMGLFFAARQINAGDESEAPPLEIDTPGLWIKGVESDVKVKVNAPLAAGSTAFVLYLDSRAVRRLLVEPGGAVEFKDVVVDAGGEYVVSVSGGGYFASSRVRVINGFWTLLPPLVAIGLALVFRQVLAALWVSIWLGALIVYDWHPLTAVGRSIDHYIIGAMADSGHAAMLVFILFMGGMIGMIARSGGIQGIVELIARRATSARRGQLATWVMGLLIFFDDYANTIIVGNTMRPISDRLRISREKLAYIVDSTAAPVASIVPISTWIGYEVGLINDALGEIAEPLQQLGSVENGYMLFLESVLYRFYPILALALVALTAIMGREFGPMARAERRARVEGKPLGDNAIPMSSLEARNMDPPAGKPRRWFNATVPLAAVVVITFAGLWVNGMDNLGGKGHDEVLVRAEKLIEDNEYGPVRAAAMGKVYVLGQVYSEASANVVLAWASLGGCIITLFMVVFQRILTLGESMQAWLTGAESMLIAVVILLFAWSLGQVCLDLHTAEYLTTSLAGVLSPRLLPALTFVLAAGISFATGTSYGTMGILIPLAIPIASQLAMDGNYSADDHHLVLVGVVSSVLAGSVFGDHCSPISDTTIMSSMASSSDHVDHVKTQLPYAILAAGIGIVLGDIPTAYGLSPFIGIALGVAALIGFLYFFGKRPVEREPVSDRPGGGEEGPR